MVRLLDTNLYVGNIEDISHINDDEWAVVHATQTIHYKIFNWNRTTNKPNKEHPNYIVYENNNRLSLNWVDGPAHLYKWTGNDTFISILDFIDKWIGERKILVHCDQAFSRSPSVCLLYLAKRTTLIPSNSFVEAMNEFLKIYPQYSPGGIGDYLKENWDLIS